MLETGNSPPNSNPNSSPCARVVSGHRQIDASTAQKTGRIPGAKSNSQCLRSERYESKSRTALAILRRARSRVRRASVTRRPRHTYASTAKDRASSVCGASANGFGSLRAAATCDSGSRPHSSKFWLLLGRNVTTVVMANGRVHRRLRPQSLGIHTKCGQ